MAGRRKSLKVLLLIAALVGNLLVVQSAVIPRHSAAGPAPSNALLGAGAGASISLGNWRDGEWVSISTSAILLSGSRYVFDVKHALASAGNPGFGGLTKPIVFSADGLPVDCRDYTYKLSRIETEVRAVLSYHIEVEVDATGPYRVCWYGKAVGSQPEVPVSLSVADAPCRVACVPPPPPCPPVTSLQVYKTAEGEALKTLDWGVAKSVNPEQITLAVGETGAADYTVVVKQQGATVTAGVSGTITIVNDEGHPGEDKTAYVTYVDDVVEARCGSSWVEIARTRLSGAFTIPTGNTVHIPYEVEFDPYCGATAYRNTVLVRLANHAPPPGSTHDFHYTTEFCLPAPEIVGEMVEVEDSLQGYLGQVSGVGAQETFEYQRDLGPYASPGQYSVPNTVTITAEDTGLHKTDSACVVITVPEPPVTPGSITVRKLDEQGQPLAGATFALYLGQTLLGQVDLGSASEHTFSPLGAGVYDVVEVTAPAGYQKASPDTQTVVLAQVGYVVENKTVEFRNTLIPVTPGSIKVRKFDAQGQPLAGATFALYQGQTLLEQVDLGSATYHMFTGLAAGTYLVVEVAAPVGYLKAVPDSQMVTLAQVGYAVESKTVDFYNSLIPVTPGSITVVKLMEGCENSLPGATFALYQGQTLLEQVDLGPASQHTFTGLAAGTYVVVEVTAPPGYLKAIPDSQTVVLTQIGYAIENKTVVFSNSPIPVEPGSITVRKFGPQGQPLPGATFALYLGQTLLNQVDLGSASEYAFGGLGAGIYDVVEVTAPTGYQKDSPDSRSVVLAVVGYAVQNKTVDFVNTPIPVTPGSITARKLGGQGQPLAGATFALYQGQTLLSQVDLGSASEHTFPGLAAGTYTVVEVTAPYGYLKASPSTKMVTLSQVGYAVESKTVEFVNVPEPPSPPSPGSLTVKKVDEDGDPLAAAMFKLYRDNWDLTWGAGDVLVSTAGPAGSTLVFGGLSSGPYWLEEATCPSGYVPAGDNPRLVVLGMVGDDVEDLTITVANDRQTGSITVHKTNGSAGGVPLDGASFSLRLDDGDGILDSGDGLVAGPTPTVGGRAAFSGLEQGSYWVVEAIVPAGFVGDEPVLVELSPGLLDHSLVQVNYLYQPGRITVRNHDSSTGYPLLDGATFELFVDNGDGVYGFEDSNLAGPVGTVGGIVSFPDLGPGTYWVTQTTAPEGYSGDPEPVRDVLLIISGGAVSNTTVDFYCSQIHVIIIPPELPTTGTDYAPILLLGVACLLVGFGLALGGRWGTRVSLSGAYTQVCPDGAAAWAAAQSKPLYSKHWMTGRRQQVRADL